MAELGPDHHRYFPDLNLVILEETFVRNHRCNTSLRVLLCILNLADLDGAENFCLVS